MITFILKNKLRRELLFWRKFGIVWLFLFAGLFVLFTRFHEAIVPFLYNHRGYIFLQLALILMLIYFFRQYPLLLVDPAHIHFLKGTAWIRCIIYVKGLLLMVNCIVLSMILTLATSNGFSGIGFLYFFSTLSTWQVLMWKKYHASLPVKMKYIGILIISIPMVFSAIEIGLSLNAVLLTLLLLSTHERESLNLVKYQRHLRYMYRNMAIQLRGCPVEINTLMQESIANKDYAIKYPEKTKVNPLVVKAIVIDAFRTTPNVVWIMKGTMLATSLLIYFTNFFQGMDTVIFVMIVSMLITSFIRDSAQNVLVLSSKCKRGLFLPYNKKTLVIAYSFFPIIMALITFIVVATFTSVPLINLIISFLLCVSVVFIWNFWILCAIRRQKAIHVFMSVLSSITLMLLMAIRLF